MKQLPAADTDWKWRGMFFASACTLIALFPASNPRAEEAWLVGTWQGHLQGGWAADNGTREMTVDSVAADGTALAKWRVGGHEFTNTSTKVIDEKSIEITVPSSGSRTALQRDGDNRLVGTFTVKNGISYPITLTKAKSPNPFDGIWIGDATPEDQSRCWRGSYHITIRNGEIVGQAAFDPTSTSTGGINFTNTAAQTSDVTGEAWSDGTVFFALNPTSSRSRKSRFVLQATANGVTGFDKGTSCGYHVSLRRK